VALRPLVEDRERIDRIIERLELTDDLPERADLASELVRAASRHEDVVEHAVVPAVQELEEETSVTRITGQRQEIRQAMEYIHGRTQHLAARNAHADDPQGLEDAITDVTGKLRLLLAGEDDHLIPLLGQLDPDAVTALTKAVEKASRHAAERPKPARTALGKRASNIATKIDHVLEDVATPDHAGAKTVEG